MHPRLLPAIAAAIVTLPAVTADRPEPVRGEQGMVVSRSQIASSVGADVIGAGGNAVDAAVAVGFALAVAHPSAGNLGGGGFMVIRLADGELVANDHRERAPAAAHRDMFVDARGNVVEGLSTDSHLAAGVPGTVAGLLDIHERYGALPLSDVIDPAITLARDGFPLPPDLASDFASHQSDFARHAASKAVFSRTDGTPYEPGDLFMQEDLADTLARIRDEGRDGFYKGKTAELLVAEMQRGGGRISQADLDDYRSVWRDPVIGTYRGFDVVSMPPPSSGGILLVQMLNMLERYNLRTMGAGSARAIHHMVEAARRAYADRAMHLGDADFYPVPVGRLIDKAYAVVRFGDFDPRRASASADVGAGYWKEAGGETTHVSVMDAAGNAVAYTTTLNFSYGSKIVVPGAGFLLNNEMDDFSARENAPNAYGLLGGEANSIAPGKRMLSSMTPTILLWDGRPFFVTGSPGGSTIITTVLQVIVNGVDHRMNLVQAVSQPRFHHQWQPDRILFEPGVSEETVSALRSMRHREVVILPTARLGKANSVMRIRGALWGFADPRAPGAAAGI
ncbi:MAG: gamma-glutamyltransferase [Gammaproteobacteria bacterium]|nr:gamma-glutamyltransferase [Gammaproteobacteria bacterium]